MRISDWSSDVCSSDLLAFHHLETIGGHEDRLGRLVHAVVGPADALGEPRGALRRAHMDDEIDVAPIETEVERRGRSEERRVGKEWVRTCRSRWSPYQSKTKNKHNTSNYKHKSK